MTKSDQTIEDIGEGDVLNNIFYRRFFRDNKNILLGVIGTLGSGKSWSCLSMCESWYNKVIHKEFTADNIGFHPEDVMKRIVNGNLKPGELLILEEAGTSMGNLDFQTKTSKLFNYVLQTFRQKRIGLIINLPYFTMLNKQTRMLLNMIAQTETIDRSTNKVILKPYHLQWNQYTGKCYFHRPKVLIDGVYEKVSHLSYSRPSEKLVNDYELKKGQFVDRISGSVLTDMTKYIQNRKALTELQSQILEFWKKGIFNQNTIAKAVNKPAPRISENYKWMRQKGYLKEEFMLNQMKGTKIEASKPIRPPIEGYALIQTQG